MPATHVVVDGSNIATEGRPAPSLRQLDDAVRQFQEEFPEAETVVVVDATFGHRIDASERKAFDEAVSHGELVSPPAGAIGRGDAFVLRIAERVGGQVLSNDSFQEFHAEHPWLFDEGRLIGGKPVPGVGWIFTPRRPVRGPRSRTGLGEADGHAGGGGPAAAPTTRRRRRGRSAAVLEAVEAAAAAATEAATTPEPAPSVPEDQAARRSSRRTRRRGGRRPPTGDPAVVAAIEAAKEEAVASGDQTPGKKTGEALTAGATGGPQAVNDPLTFVRFITAHPLGDEIDGEVANFVSHGAMVDVGDMHCYVPLSGLGAPPPKSARAVLHKGEHRLFVVVCLDPPRRGVQLALAELRDELGLDLPKPQRRRTTAKEAKAAKSAKAAKAAKAARSVKTTKPAKAAKADPPTAPRSKGGSQPDNFSKTSKQAARRQPVSKKTEKAAKSAKPARPAKSASPAKHAMHAKTSKTSKASKASKASKTGDRRGPSTS